MTTPADNTNGLMNADSQAAKPVAGKPNAAGASVCHLKEVREFYGLSQRDVAAAIGSSPMTLCHMERGSNLPNLRTALKVAKFFGLKVEDLWQLND